MPLALLTALLLGLRHATDPDHLTAVSTLVMSDRRRGGRLAARLGLAWGAGHAVTLLALGLPVVLLHSSLPEAVRRAAEMAIGVVIVALAARLLLRWRRHCFHVHPHSHGALSHAHPHAHERGRGHTAEHAHPHPDALGRTPLAAFGIGLVHGAGGSAGTGILMVSAMPGRAAALLGLVLFAAGTALSMGALSSGFGHALARSTLLERSRRAVPALGLVAVLFGVWYALGALATLPHPS